MSLTSVKELPGLAPASDKKILVVDDEPDVRNFLKTCIQDAGFIVDSAVDGQDALEKIEDQTPDLMTLDMVMPRKTGIELIQTLRANEKWQELPIIVITAHAQNEFANEDLKRLNAFSPGLRPRKSISKPVTPQKIVNAICDILQVAPVAQPVENQSLTTDEEKMLKLFREGDPGKLDQLKQFLNTC